MRYAALMLLPVVAGCAGAPVTQPASLDQGMLISRIAIKGRELPNFRRHPADTVYWARVNAHGDLDLDHPVETTHKSEGDTYAFGVQPGRYAPFAAAYDGLRIRFLAKLDPELRKQLAVDVPRGGVGFTGETLVRTEWEGVLVALEHVGMRLASLVPPFKRRVVDVPTQLPKVDKTPELELAALKRARRAAAGTLWIERLDERIAALGNPPERLYTGLIRKKPVAPTRADRFSYIDTLEWGQARAIDGGLEWREPKSRARVAVAFVSYSSRTLERQLEALRLAGSAEDDHVLYDVRVGSLPAHAARFTTYSYGTQKLVGAETKVHVTEALVVPDRDGYYLIVYRARKEDFDAFRPLFSRFVSYLKFLGPRSPYEKGPA